MIENLSAPAQNAPLTEKRYSTKEFAEVTGVRARTLEDLRSKRKSRLMPAGYDEKGMAYYTADQIDVAKQFCRTAKKLPPALAVSLFDSSTNETVEANDDREDDGSNDDADDVAENIAVTPPADTGNQIQDATDDDLPKTAEAAHVEVLAAVEVVSQKSDEREVDSAATA